MTTLNELRQRIDAVDDELLVLLNRRAALVVEVGQQKAQAAQPMFVPEREQRIVERLQDANPGPFPTEALRAVFSEVISACLSLEHPLRVAYLGPEATFTHQAARARFGLSAVYVPAPTIHGAFLEVEKGLCDLAVVPIENSTEGVVHSTLDVLIESTLTIVAEARLEVNHCLLSRSGSLDGLSKVYSHPQALGQCGRWLAANLPHAALIDVASTALAARLAKDDPEAGAVASEIAGQLYDLKVAQRRIEDSDGNETRFLVVARPGAVAAAQNAARSRTSLLVTAEDGAGALHRILAPLAAAGVNLSRIESRPSRKKPWGCVFFIDCDGHAEAAPLDGALAVLRTVCDEVKVLGSYPVDGGAR